MGGKLWSISVHCSSYHRSSYYPPHSAMCQASCTCISGAACTQLAGVKVRKKDLVLQIWMICVLAVCWLCKEVSSSYCCITLHCYNPLFLWPKWFPGDLKDWCPILLSLSFFFSTFGTRYYQTRTFRNNCNVWGKLKVITNIWREKSGWNIPNLMKDVNINIQVSQWLQVKWIWKDPDQDTL